MQTLARLAAHLCDVLPLGRRERLQARRSRTQWSGAVATLSGAPCPRAALGISPSPRQTQSTTFGAPRGTN